MRVVPLRRMGKSLGCEKVVLKQGRMTLFFVSNVDSPFYRSEAFDHILSFVAQNPRRCNFREVVVATDGLNTLIRFKSAYLRISKNMLNFAARKSLRIENREVEI